MYMSQQAAGPVFWHSCLLRKITLWDPTDPVWQGIGGREEEKEGLGWYKSEHENHSSASVAYLHARSCQTLNIICNIKTASCHWHGSLVAFVNKGRFCNCFPHGLSSDMKMHAKKQQLWFHEISQHIHTGKRKITAQSYEFKPVFLHDVFITCAMQPELNHWCHLKALRWSLHMW